MPIAALCANISLEMIFTFVLPHDAPQIYVNYIWFSLDVVIVIQFLKYGKKEFPSIPKWQIFAIFALGVSITAPLILGISNELGDSVGAYAAFGQNLMMSILFVTILINRQGIGVNQYTLHYSR